MGLLRRGRNSFFRLASSTVARGVGRGMIQVSAAAPATIPPKTRMKANFLLIYWTPVSSRLFPSGGCLARQTDREAPRRGRVSALANGQRSRHRIDRRLDRQDT